MHGGREFLYLLSAFAWISVCAPVVLNNQAGLLHNDNDKTSIIRERYYMFSNVPLHLSKFYQLSVAWIDR